MSLIETCFCLQLYGMYKQNCPETRKLFNRPRLTYIEKIITHDRPMSIISELKSWFLILWTQKPIIWSHLLCPTFDEFCYRLTGKVSGILSLNEKHKYEAGKKLSFCTLGKKKGFIKYFYDFEVELTNWKKIYRRYLILNQENTAITVIFTLLKQLDAHFLDKHKKWYVFCYQNCSDLLWEKIVLVIEKNFWNSRLKAENFQNVWDH